MILFNGRFASTRPALRAVQAAGIPWRVHERGCDPEHYYLYDFVPHDMGRWCEQIDAESRRQSWESLKEGARQYYGRRRAGGAKDWHSFAHWKQGDLGRYEHLRAQKPVVYMSSSDDEWAAIGEILQYACFPRQIEALRHTAQCCADAGRPLVVRLHPHLAQKHPADLVWWHQQLRELPGRITVIDAGEKLDSYAMLDAAAVSVSYGSTVGIEGMYWGCQHLMLGRAMYETLPGVHWVRDAAALPALLREPPPLDREGAIRYGWYMENFGNTFRHFVPDGLFGGRFQGQRLDASLGWWPWLKGKALRKQLAGVKD